MLYLPIVRMAPILWGALLVIRSRYHSRRIDQASAQMDVGHVGHVGHVGQLDGWWRWTWWYPRGWW